MERLKFLAMGVLVLGLIFFGAGKALATECATLGGAIVGGECQISTAVAKNGSFTLNETLRILGKGSITTGATNGVTPLTLLITSGDFIMETGSLIDGNGVGCFGLGDRRGDNITITLEGGNVDLKTGSIIRSNSCSGGAIRITAGNGTNGNIKIAGLIESVGYVTGTGATQPPGGGPIWIDATCDLIVENTGRISSRGSDPGADLVHLEGCTVEIYGRVESTGPGHGIPNSPANHCNGAFRPGKPSNSTGCVEVWSGTTILIDSTGPNKGEINVDIGIRGGTQGRGWIDLFANGDITITDGAGNDYTYDFGGGCTFYSQFAVHANGGLCQTTDDGGLITIQSTKGNVIATGNAIQADATSAGSRGGEIIVEAHGNINFTNASIFARGDFVAVGGYGLGGKIGNSTAPIRAFNGSLSWTSGVGNVMPTGTGVGAANRGVIFLRDCLPPAGVALGDPLIMFPYITAQTTPTVLADACDPTKPTLPTYVTLPPANCQEQCEQPPPALKKGMKFNDLNQNGFRDPGEPGLAGWKITLFGTDINGNPVNQAAFTDLNGNYSFSVPAGTYIICETQKVGWIQSYPTSGADCSTHGGGIGYSVTLNPGDVEEGNDFGNYFAGECPQDPKADCTITVDPSGTIHAGSPNYLTLQEAYNNATNGDIICMFGNTVENVLLGGDKTLKITQCTMARITAADKNLPVIRITSTGNLTIVSPDTVGGTIGWLVETDSHELKSIRANNASQYGVLVLSDNNRISWNNVGGNGVGIRVEGDFNDLRGGTVEKNSGDGVQFSPTANNNSLRGATVQNNSGNGILMQGSFNTIRSNGRVNQNSLNGILVTGNNNTIESNAAEGNGQDGFKVSGNSNTIRDNTASKNLGDGFEICGTGNRLQSNSSNQGSSGGKNENLGYEYCFVAGTTVSNNKIDGVNFTCTTGNRCYESSNCAAGVPFTCP